MFLSCDFCQSLHTTQQGPLSCRGFEGLNMFPNFNQIQVELIVSKILYDKLKLTLSWLRCKSFLSLFSSYQVKNRTCAQYRTVASGSQSTPAFTNIMWFTLTPNHMSVTTVGRITGRPQHWPCTNARPTTRRSAPKLRLNSSLNMLNVSTGTWTSTHQRTYL